MGPLSAQVEGVLFFTFFASIFAVRWVEYWGLIME